MLVYTFTGISTDGNVQVRSWTSFKIYLVTSVELNHPEGIAFHTGGYSIAMEYSTGTVKLFNPHGTCKLIHTLEGLAHPVVVGVPCPEMVQFGWLRALPIKKLIKFC